jgi:hypothetical protein
MMRDLVMKKKWMRCMLGATLLCWGVSGLAQHLDVKVSTSAGPVAGSLIQLDVYGDLAWYLENAGGLPIEYTTGRRIFPANFSDPAGGPYSTDNPGFQSFAGQFVRDEELHFRAQGNLRHLAVGATEWVTAPSGGVRLFGAIPEDIVFDFVFNGTRQAEYEFYEAGTLFSGTGITGPVTAPIGAASTFGSMHYHLDWDLEGASAQDAKGAYLLTMSVFSTATVGGAPKYVESEPFHVLFRNGITDEQFGAAMQTLTVPATPAPEPATWMLAAGGLLVMGWAVRRRQVRT